MSDNCLNGLSGGELRYALDYRCRGNTLICMDYIATFVTTALL